MLLSLVVHVVFAATTPSAPPSPTAVSDTISVGHPALRAITLRLGTDTSQVFAIQNGERKLLNTGIVTIASTPTGYLVALKNESPRATAIDSVWVDRGTFATRRHVEITTNAFRRLTFDGTHVTGTIKDSTGEHTVDQRLERAELDNSIIGVLSNALPYKAGYSATLGSYDISGRYLYLTMHVVGTESIASGSGTVDAWKIAMDATNGPMTWTSVRWIDSARKKEVQWTIKLGEREMISVTK